MNNDLYSVIDSLEEIAEDFVSSLTVVSAKDLGLDPRSGYKLYVNPTMEDCIIVETERDSTLQYYGGFEYVAKEFRMELGRKYVSYSSEDDRVANCLSNLK